MKKIIGYIKGHKKISFFVLVILLTSTYFIFKNTGNSSTEIQHVTSSVEKGMLISSISGTGQVSTSAQVDLKPKVSGDIVAVSVVSGQEVKKDDLMVQIDAGDAWRNVSEAQASLESAQLDLEELLAPEDELTMVQAQNDLYDAQDTLVKLKTSQENEYQDMFESKEKAEDNLEKAYEDAYNDISNAFLDLPDIMTGLYTILYSDEISDTELTVSQKTNGSALRNAISRYDDQEDFDDYLDDADDAYSLAKDDYDDNFDLYKDTSRYSDREDIEQLLEQTVETTKQIATAVKSQTNTLDWWVEYRTDNDLSIYSKVNSYQNSLSSYTADTNSHVSGLLATERSIEDYKEDLSDAITDIAEMEQNHPLELAQAKRNILEKEEKLKDLENGATDLEIKNKQLSVQQKTNSLVEARLDYSDHFVRAPFDGTIASLDVALGDTISSNTSVSTIITDQMIAEIPLNEIDAAEVEVGQKVNISFDAIEDLEITGEVVEIDTLGAVSSGVVSYDVKISFDIQDERIKSGMSVSVTIIIQSKAGVLLVPISAVKSQGTSNYVEILVNGVVTRQTVTTGDSSDLMIEILEGLNEGDEYISQTITSGNSSSSSTQSKESPGQGNDTMKQMRMLQ